MTINMKALRRVIESPVAITLVTAARRRGDEISLGARVLLGSGAAAVVGHTLRSVFKCNSLSD